MAISILLLSSSFFVTPAFAAFTVTVSSEVGSGQGILPNSPKTALLKLQFTANTETDTLHGISAAVIDAGGVDSGDIHSLSIYRDGDVSATPGSRNGVFDSGDTLVGTEWVCEGIGLGTTFGDLLFPFTNSLNESPWSGTDLTWSYFIVVQTSGSISHADAFRGQLNNSVWNSGNSSLVIPSPNPVVTCECKVVDIYYTESDTNLSQTWDLVAGDTQAYWKPNYLSYAISQEMTEPTQLYSLSEAKRYSFLDVGEYPSGGSKEAYSNFLKFERRRKLMGMNVPTPVLGIKVAGKNQFQPYDLTYYDTDYFDTMVITFTDTLRPDTANFDPQTMLLPIFTASPAGNGVAVYQDTNRNGRFDVGIDTALNIASGGYGDWSGNQKTLTLSFKAPGLNSQAAIPQLFDADLNDGTGHDTTGVDFFVVLRGDPANMAYGADFTARITGMSFRGAKPPEGQFTSYETGEIKAVFELSDYTGTRVDPNTTFPVIGINVNTGDAGISETLESFTFYLKKGIETDTYLNPAIDLAAVSGVTVLDRTTGDTVPIALSSWSTVSYQGENWWATTVTFNSPVSVPADDMGGNSGPDYFIRLTTSSSFGYNKRIVAAIPDNGFTFGVSLKTSAKGTALITNANIDYGSNSRVYPDINPSAPVHNPILGNPSVVFSQLNNTVVKNSAAVKIIRIVLASNTTADIQPVLKSVVVQIVPGTGFLYNDLAAMDTNPALSGIGLYTSDGAPIELAFKPTSNFVPMGEAYRRYLLVLRDPLPLPQSLDVSIKSSNTISSLDAMIVRIWGSEITPCSSYGLGFRPKDTTGADTAVETHLGTYNAYDAMITDSVTLALGTALGGLDTNYNNNWYLVITAGVPPGNLGQVYKVISVTDAVGTPAVTVDGADLTLAGDPGTPIAVKFFKVESTSYNHIAAPVVCSGIGPPTVTGPLTITPSDITIGDTAVVTINLSGIGDADGDNLTVTFYATDAAGADTRYIPGSFPVTPPYPKSVATSYNNFAGWPAGTRRLYAEISDGINPALLKGPTTFTLNSPAGPPPATIAITDVTVANQGILPLSGKTAVLRIGVSGTAPQTFSSATVTFYDANSGDVASFAASDLKDVAIYRDSAGTSTGSSTYGVFDPSDSVAMTPVTPGSLSFPLNLTSPVGLSSTVQYFFVVIRTSETISGNLTDVGDVGDSRDKFTVNATTVNAAGGIVSTTTNAIICESRVVDLIPWRSDKYQTNHYPGSLEDSRYSYPPLEDRRQGGQDHPGFVPEPELMPMNAAYRVLGLDVAAPSGFTAGGYTTEYLRKLVVTFKDTGIPNNFNAAADLASHILAKYPNVSLWRDNGDGIFDPASDSRIKATNGAQQTTNHVPVAQQSDGTWRATLEFDSNLINALEPTVDGKVDFFVVISTVPDHGWVTETPYYGADFKVYIEPSTSSDPSNSSNFVAFDYATPEIATSPSQLARPESTVKEVHTVFSLQPFTDGPAEADGLPVSLFALNLCDGYGLNETLEWVRVWFKGTDGFKPSRLSPMSDDDLSGVSLWRDNKESRGGDTLGLPDPRAGITRLSIGDTLIPLSADSFEWYNSDGSIWGPDNDDPANSNDDKRYFIIVKPKVALQLYPTDYVESTSTDSNIYAGYDFFICVRARGVEDAPYNTSGWQGRGMDYGVPINAAIGLTNSNDTGHVAVFVNNNNPWEDILFGSGFKARVFPNGTDPILSGTYTTVPTFFTDLTQSGQTINPYQKTEAIGINLVAPPDKNISFNHFALNIIDSGVLNFNFPELVAPGSDPNDPNGGCGIALYKDNKSAGTPGVFDPADIRVVMTQLPILDNNINDPGNWNRIRLFLDPVSVGNIPTDDAGVNGGPDYFLVIQPNSNMESGDDFYIELWGSDIGGARENTISFTGDAGGITYKRIITNVLTNRTVSVTILNDLTIGGQGVDATSDPTGAIGINVYDAAVANTLNQVRVYFNPVSDALLPDSALASTDITNASGISVWRDSNNDGLFDWRADTFLPSVSSGWQSDYVNGFVDGDGTLTDGPGTQEVIANPAGTALTWFKSTDNVCWYDGDNNTIWTAGDGLWTDNNYNHQYDTGEPLIIRGTLIDGTQGVLIHDGVNGFAYRDDGATPAAYERGENIYFLGRGRSVLGYYADLNLSPLPALPVSDSNHGPDFFVVFRTGANINYGDQFSFSLPSNAINYSSGYSFSNVNLTTNTLRGRIPVFLTDLVASGATIRELEPKPVIGINLHDSALVDTNYLSEVNVYLTGTNIFADLVALSTTSGSGVALYKDTYKGAGGQGVFDQRDTFVTPVSITLLGGNRIRLTFANSANNLVPHEDTGTDSGNDYFIVLRAGNAVTAGDTIRTEIRSSLSATQGTGLKFAGTGGSSEEYLTGTNQLTCSLAVYLTLTITAPATSVVLPSGTTFYNIQWTAMRGGGGAPTSQIFFYYATDTDPTVTTPINSSGIPYAVSGTYAWDVRTVPPGTYYVYGRLVEGAALATDYSAGTVTITNSSPTAIALSIQNSPAPGPGGVVGNSAQITLTGLNDADHNNLSVFFYSTDSTGLDTRLVPGVNTVTFPYSAAYNPPIWNTFGVPKGNRRLYAVISDGVNSPNTFPVTPGGKAFTVNHPSGITITKPSTLGEKALNRQFLIQWTAAGLDSEGETVRLEYDLNNTPVGETLVPGAAARPATDGSYLWDTTAAVNGTYYIKATILDGVWTDSYSYSVGTVDVTDFVSPDTTIHIIQPAVDILLDGATDNILYPLPSPVINRGQALAPFRASDNIRWFDTWVRGEWDPGHDALWLDPDGDGLYGSEDTRLAGVAPTIGSSGTLLTSLNPFAYWDVNSSAQWGVGEAILYEEGEGNRRFYYSDPVVHITWNTTPSGGIAGADTILKLYLEKSGILDEIYSDTVLAGSPLAGSFDYDFSQLTMLQHGLYHVILRVIDPNGWYLPVDHYALSAPLIPVIITVDSAPNLIITRPEMDVDIWPGYPYNLTYIATDPDSDALFGLYAYDAATADTYLIVGPLTDTDGADSYLWYASLDASIPRDTYLNIMGVISDGVWTDTTQAIGRVRILETAPSVLLKANSTDTVIILTWTDNTPPGETKTYTIWRQDVTAVDSPLVMIEGPGESNPPEPILIDPATNTYQYTDNDVTLQNDHVYYYYVVVNITEGGNAYVFNSNTVAAMLIAFNQNPTGLGVVPGRLMANLSWNWVNGNVILEDGFSIERRVRGAQTFTVIGGIPGNDVIFGLYTDFAYSDTMLRQQGNFWQYRVRAFKVYANGNVGYSGYSSIVETEIMPLLDTTAEGSGGGSGGGGAVGPLAVGISALLGWWKRRRKMR